MSTKKSSDEVGKILGGIIIDICETSITENSQVAIGEGGTVDYNISDHSNKTKFMSLGSPSSIDDSFAMEIIGSVDTGENSGSKEVAIDWGNKFVDPIWDFIEATATKNLWIVYLGPDVTEDLAFLFPETSSQFAFGKIKLLSKIDADRSRRLGLCKLDIGR